METTLDLSCTDEPYDINNLGANSSSETHTSSTLDSGLKILEPSPGIINSAKGKSSSSLKPPTRAVVPTSRTSAKSKMALKVTSPSNLVSIIKVPAQKGVSPAQATVSAKVKAPPHVVTQTAKIVELTKYRFAKPAVPAAPTVMLQNVRPSLGSAIRPPALSPNVLTRQRALTSINTVGALSPNVHTVGVSSVMTIQGTDTLPKSDVTLINLIPKQKSRDLVDTGGTQTASTKLLPVPTVRANKKETSSRVKSKPAGASRSAASKSAGVSGSAASKPANVSGAAVPVITIDTSSDEEYKPGPSKTPLQKKKSQQKAKRQKTTNTAGVEVFKYFVKKPESKRLQTVTSTESQRPSKRLKKAASINTGVDSSTVFTGDASTRAGVSTQSSQIQKSPLQNARSRNQTPSSKSKNTPTSRRGASVRTPPAPKPASEVAASASQITSTVMRQTLQTILDEQQDASPATCEVLRNILLSPASEFATPRSVPRSPTKVPPTKPAKSDVIVLDDSDDENEATSRVQAPATPSRTPRRSATRTASAAAGAPDTSTSGGQQNVAVIAPYQPGQMQVPQPFGNAAFCSRCMQCVQTPNGIRYPCLCPTPQNPNESAVNSPTISFSMIPNPILDPATVSTSTFGHTSFNNPTATNPMMTTAFNNPPLYPTPMLSVGNVTAQNIQPTTSVTEGNDDCVVSDEGILTSVGTYKCVLCDKYFFNYAALKTHSRQSLEHKNNLKRKNGKPIVPSKSSLNKRKACELCNRTFKSMSALSSHVRSPAHKRMIQSQKQKKSKLFRCQHCTETFTTHEAKWMHETSHSELYRTNSPSTRTQHSRMSTRRGSASETSSPAPSTTRTTDSPIQTRRSAVIVIGDVRKNVNYASTDAPAPAPVRTKAPTVETKRSTKLSVTKVTPKVTCKICGKIFKRLSDLMAHQRGPMCTAKFHCTYCSKPMFTKYRLVVHEKTHFENTHFGRKSNRLASTRSAAEVSADVKTPALLVCDNCGYRFSNDNSYLRHQASCKTIKLEDSTTPLAPTATSKKQQKSAAVSDVKADASPVVATKRKTKTRWERGLGKVKSKVKKTQMYVIEPVPKRKRALSPEKPVNYTVNVNNVDLLMSSVTVVVPKLKDVPGLDHRYSQPALDYPSGSSKKRKIMKKPTEQKAKVVKKGPKEDVKKSKPGTGTKSKPGTGTKSKPGTGTKPKTNKQTTAVLRAHEKLTKKNSKGKATSLKEKTNKNATKGKKKTARASKGTIKKKSTKAMKQSAGISVEMETAPGFEEATPSDFVDSTLAGHSLLMQFNLGYVDGMLESSSENTATEPPVSTAQGETSTSRDTSGSRGTTTVIENQSGQLRIESVHSEAETHSSTPSDSNNQSEQNDLDTEVTSRCQYCAMTFTQIENKVVHETTCVKNVDCVSDEECEWSWKNDLFVVEENSSLDVSNDRNLDQKPTETINQQMAAAVQSSSEQSSTESNEKQVTSELYGVTRQVNVEQSPVQTSSKIDTNISSVEQAKTEANTEQTALEPTVEQAATEPTVKLSNSESPAEPNYQQSPAEPDIDESPAEPDIEESHAEPDVKEIPTEPEVKESPDEADADESPAEADADESPAEPDIEESTAEPNVKEIPTEPDANESLAEPEVKESPAEPDFDESPAKPAVEESPAEPEIEESPAGPDIKEIPTETDVDDSATEPEVKEGRAEPDVEESPAEPDVEESPAEPEVEESPAGPDIKEIPTEPDVDESPAEPDVEESPAKQQVKDGPAEPGVVESPAEPDVKEIPTELGVDESPAEPDVEDEIPAEPEVEESPDEPDVDESPAKPDIERSPAKPDVAESLCEAYADECLAEQDCDESPADAGVDELRAAPDIGESPAIPDIDESPAAPDMDESPDEPDIGESPAEANIDQIESPAKPDIDESPAEPDIDESPAEPDIDESPAEPNIDESPAEPDIYDSSPKPDIDESPAEPDTDESPAEPDIDESPTETNIDESPAEPDIDESPAEPDIDDSPAEPDIDESPAEPAIDDSPARPDIDESPAEPDMDKSPGQPYIDESPAELTRDESPAEPDVEGSLAEPDVEDNRAQPDIDRSPGEPTDEESSAEPDVVERSAEPADEGSPAEPDVEDIPVEPDVKESAAEPDVEQTSFEPSVPQIPFEQINDAGSGEATIRHSLHESNATTKGSDVNICESVNSPNDSPVCLNSEYCENLPASSRENLPGSSGGNLPASSHENLPGSSRENLPATSRENLPGSSGENLPASSHENLPATSREHLPGNSGIVNDEFNHLNNDNVEISNIDNNAACVDSATNETGTDGGPITHSISNMLNFENSSTFVSVSNPDQQVYSPISDADNIDVSLNASNLGDVESNLTVQSDRVENKEIRSNVANDSRM